jgi:hypothetical protein
MYGRTWSGSVFILPRSPPRKQETRRRSLSGDSAPAAVSFVFRGCGEIADALDLGSSGTPLTGPVRVQIPPPPLVLYCGE